MTFKQTEQLKLSMISDLAADGKPAQLFVLKNTQGMCVTLMDIGATWLSCEINTGDEVRDVVLGVNSMAEHRQQTAFLGATIGRFANRIAQGQFCVKGKQYVIPANDGGNALHGGADGFDKRRWQAKQKGNSEVCFTLFSKDGDQGFPGNLDVTVIYRLSENNKLSISYQAITDKACPVNLTNHAYFNLMGSASNTDCLDHNLQIHADEYLPTDKYGIPIGPFYSVDNTGFDFRKVKKIGCDFLVDDDQKLLAGYDHSYLIPKSYQNGKSVVARCISPDNKVSLEVRTTKPAMQFYSGNHLEGTANRHKGEYQKQAGFALETQFLVDAPNHPEWGKDDPILEVGDVYQHETSYQFNVHSN